MNRVLSLILACVLGSVAFAQAPPPLGYPGRYPYIDSYKAQSATFFTIRADAQSAHSAGDAFLADANGFKCSNIEAAQFSTANFAEPYRTQWMNWWLAKKAYAEQVEADFLALWGFPPTVSSMGAIYVDQKSKAVNWEPY